MPKVIGDSSKRGFTNCDSSLGMTTLAFDHSSSVLTLTVPAPQPVSCRSFLMLEACRVDRLSHQSFLP